MSTQLLPPLYFTTKKPGSEKGGAEIDDTRYSVPVQCFNCTQELYAICRRGMAVKSLLQSAACPNCGVTGEVRVRQ